MDFIRGDTLTIEFSVLDLNDNPIEKQDIEDIILTARQYPKESSPVLFTKSKNDFNFEDGVVQVTINPEDTEKLTLSTFSYDIEVTLKDGTRKSIIEEIEMTKDYTIHGGA